ncbi:hypothetical protein [Vibrio alginolyticus]|uniref:hypothetical protein n=1 Tax=Vibrio alginolyticus TaxID=663 RepID=UPI001C9D01A0|nr:hypothetical protein [Vibrio alginolyticus]MBY7685812.1 hypothetical protein [Vibrio alginolyticus]MDF4876236.1 hypothetical protein [Vibrio parahaemolyticus]
MNKVMIDLMRGCLLVLVIILVGGGGLVGYSFVANPYTGILFKVMMVGFGALFGLILASIVTGICYLLLNINDNLEKLATGSADES